MDAEVEREFNEFVARSSHRLAQFATLLVNDRHTAEDLVQTALVKAYLSWPRARNSPVAYARRIMLNQRTDWWRRLRGREQVTAEPPDAPAFGDLADAQASQDAVLQALRGLTKRERAVVVLRYFEDLPEAEIAVELEIAVGTVKSTLFRALGKLRVSPDLVPAGVTEMEIAR